MFRIRVWTSLGTHYSAYLGLPRWLSGKEPTCQCRRHRRCRFDPWARKMTRGGNGYLFQYSCLKNSMDKGAWWAIVRGIAKSQTQLSDWTCTRTHTHADTHSHNFVSKDPSHVKQKWWRKLIEVRCLFKRCRDPCYHWIQKTVIIRDSKSFQYCTNT